jgi:hypothetical protein
MMLPNWALVVLGVIALQAVVGVILLVGSLATMMGRTWRPLAGKILRVAGVLLILVVVEFIGLIIAVFAWAQNERFA